MHGTPSLCDVSDRLGRVAERREELASNCVELALALTLLGLAALFHAIAIGPSPMWLDGLWMRDAGCRIQDLASEGSKRSRSWLCRCPRKLGSWARKRS